MSYESRGPVAVLKTPKPAILFIAAALNVRDRLTDNPHVPSPSPTLDVFNTNIKSLQDAQSKVRAGGLGAAKVRDAWAKKVKKDLRKLLECVQIAADAQPNPEEAAAVILSAGMSVRGKSTRVKAPFAVKQLPVSGSVQLDARALARRAVYFWEISVDQTTWTEAGKTMRGKLVVTGLTPGRTYYFRFRALLSDGMTDVSQVVSLIVV